MPKDISEQGLNSFLTTLSTSPPVFPSYRSDLCRAVCTSAALTGTLSAPALLPSPALPTEPIPSHFLLLTGGRALRQRLGSPLGRCTPRPFHPWWLSSRDCPAFPLTSQRWTPEKACDRHHSSWQRFPRESLPSPTAQASSCVWRFT